MAAAAAPAHAAHPHPNYYHVPLQEELAKLLVERSGMTNVLSAPPGWKPTSRAQDGTQVRARQGHRAPEIVVSREGLPWPLHRHAVSATANPKVQAGFGPLVEGFIRVPINNIEAIQLSHQGNPNVVAVFFETIQGEGGVNPMHMDYLRDVRKLCTIATGS